MRRTRYTGPDGKYYSTDNFERDIRLPERTKLIAEDLYGQLSKYGLQDEKTIVFCVDDRRDNRNAGFTFTSPSSIPHLPI